MITFTSAYDMIAPSTLSGMSIEKYGMELFFALISFIVMRSPVTGNHSSEPLAIVTIRIISSLATTVSAGTEHVKSE